MRLDQDAAVETKLACVQFSMAVPAALVHGTPNLGDSSRRYATKTPLRNRSHEPWR